MLYPLIQPTSYTGTCFLCLPPPGTGVSRTRARPSSLSIYFCSVCVQWLNGLNAPPPPLQWPAHCVWGSLPQRVVPPYLEGQFKTPCLMWSVAACYSHFLERAAALHRANSCLNHGQFPVSLRTSCCVLLMSLCGTLACSQEACSDFCGDVNSCVS